MAESIDIRTCAICWHDYTDPLMLSCLHSFCKNCIIKFKSEQREDDDFLTCPSCNTSVPIPNGKIEGLPQNSWLAHQVRVAVLNDQISGGKEIHCDDCIESSLAVSYCTQCCIFLCSFCKKSHKIRRETAGHELIKSANKFDTHIPHKPMYCSHHQDEKLNIYCHECEILACRNCIGHKDHRCSEYRVAAAEIKLKEELRQCLTNCEKVIDVGTVNDAIANGVEILHQIEHCEHEATEEIKEVFRALHDALESRCELLLSKSKEIADEKRKAVSTQVAAFEKLKEHFLFASHLVTVVVESEDSDILSIKKSIKNQLTCCMEKFQNTSFEIEENPKIFTCLYAASMNKGIDKFGVVSSVHLDSASCTFEAGLAIPVATVGRKRKFMVVDGNNGRLIDDFISVLNASFVSVDGKEKEKVTVANANNCITVSCIPQRVGEFELLVKVVDQHIEHSPYRIFVKQERNYASIVKEQRTYDLGPGSYTNGVAVDANGAVYASSVNGYIQVFDNKKGCVTHTIGSKGTGDGQFSSPYGLYVVGGTLYVTDNALHRVQMFSASTGEYIGQFGGKGSQPGQFSNPKGITYNGKDQILVADYGNRRVQVFNTGGTFVQVIDCDGQNPSDLAVDNDGSIHVTYHSQSVMQVFSTDGTKIRDYYKHLRQPRGIAIDDEGYCFITAQYDDKYNSYGYQYFLHIFDKAGNPFKVIPGFNTPYGVALDREGYVYISDYNNHCVLKY